MSDKIQTVKSLEVDDVKVYEAKSGRVSLLTKGKLDILYIPDCDRFIIRLNSFKYPLSVHVPILATLQEEEAFRSYVLPNIGGHYVLKLKTAPAFPVLKNLETIFASSSQFSYKTDEEYDLEHQPQRGPIYPITSNDAHSEESNQENVLHCTPNKMQKLMKVGSYIRSGGEFFKQKALMAANYVGKNLKHSKEEVFPSQSSNQFHVKTIEELKGLNDSDSLLIEIGKYEMSALNTLSQEIEKYALIQVEKDKGFKLEPPTGPKAWPVFKKHAVDSAKTLWHGMDEALSSLSNTLKNKQILKGSRCEKLPLHQVEQSEENAPVYTSGPMQQIDSNRYALTGSLGQGNGNQYAKNTKQNSGSGHSGWDIQQENSNHYGENAPVMGQINDRRYSRKA